MSHEKELSSSEQIWHVKWKDIPEEREIKISPVKAQEKEEIGSFPWMSFMHSAGSKSSIVTYYYFNL